MQIDWITVTAQIVNFLVLVWLLQRFLYGPITRAMQRREQRIQDRLREGERREEEAANEARIYRDKQDELERQREDMLDEARDAAEEERKLLEREARDDVERRKQEWLRQLEAQRELFLQDLRRRSTEQFFLLARRALADLGDVELEVQMASGFVERLENLDRETREKVAAGCAKAAGIARIGSRFDLPADARRRITGTVHRVIADDIAVEYVTEAELACGIELRAGSQTISWSLDSYLDGLEEAVDEQLSTVLSSVREKAGE